MQSCEMRAVKILFVMVTSLKGCPVIATYDFVCCHHALHILYMNLFSSIVVGKFFGALLESLRKVEPRQYIREGESAWLILGWSSI